MLKKLVATCAAVFAAVFVIVFALPATPSAAQGVVPIPRDLQGAAGLAIPISASSLDQGSFTGELRIIRFAADQGHAVALGVVTGTLVDETGIARGIVRAVSLPVLPPATPLATPSASGGPSAQVVCDVLNLVLGPLDLDLLGLVVHLDQVLLDIDAVSGAGALLGNLLCAITNLLNFPGALATLVGLLNDLLALLS